MCCGDAEVLDLPPAVIEMLARYRGLQAERGWDWGDDRVGDVPLGPVRGARRRLRGLRRDRRLAAGRARRGRHRPAVGRRRGAGPRRRGHRPLRTAPAGGHRGADAAGRGRRRRPRRWPPSSRARRSPWRRAGRASRPSTSTGRPTVTIDGVPVSLAAAVSPTPGARLRLRAQRCARWSVTDATGGAWFPEGVLRKWDVRGRPFFHADDVTLTVPSTTLTVTCTRGLEFERRRADGHRGGPGRGASRRGASTRPRTAGTAATCTST